MSTGILAAVVASPLILLIFRNQKFHTFTTKLLTLMHKNVVEFLH